MAKTTVSRELAAQYPALADKVGQTVDVEVIRAAQKKGGKVASSDKVASAPVASKKVVKKASASKKK